ncbi:TetR/AcrR family transcriptional regulator [Xanthobacter sp. TB0139]|uniref:TetR/AcrR family transcriptional regulator n=1 Tax=Xanthobacter sp. TB0139 TaxID=3459178 RepID=UPI004039DA03
MAPRMKESPEETRERIARAAEDLFRRFGFAKTSVADIARAVEMSPANIYRFFPSKTAIVATICARSLHEVEAEVVRMAHRPGSPQERIAAVYLSIFEYHRANFLTERGVYDMVLVAIENNWAAIEAHKARIRDVLAAILEEGLQNGTFLPHAPEAVAGLLLSSCVRFCHPVLVAAHIGDDLEGDLKTHIAFILRAIERTPTPLQPALLRPTPAGAAPHTDPASCDA